MKRMSTGRVVDVGQDEVYIHECLAQPGEAGTPAVVFVSGLGDVGDVWFEVMTRLSSRAGGPRARLFAYDRLGLGRSGAARAPRTAVQMARELKQLLAVAGMSAPYVFVMSSYGGIIGRELLAANDADVAGMVFVDANQERTLAARQWPEEAWGNTVPHDLDVYKANELDRAKQYGGVDDSFERVATWEREKRRAKESGSPTADDLEGQHCLSSLAHLASHSQLERQALGDRPVSVIQANLTRDLQRMVDAGKATGNGTAADHAELNSFLKRLPDIEHGLHCEILKLSSVHHFVHSSTAGHLVMLWEPELVVQEIEWCVEQVVRRTSDVK